MSIIKNKSAVLKIPFILLFISALIFVVAVRDSHSAICCNPYTGKCPSTCLEVYHSCSGGCGPGSPPNCLYACAEAYALCTDPVVTFSPALYSFTDTLTGNVSTSETFTITNIAGCSDASMTIISVSIADDPSNFIIQADNCSGHILAGSAGNCWITVAFAPKTQGAKNAHLSVSYTQRRSGTYTQTAAISGLGKNNLEIILPVIINIQD